MKRSFNEFRSLLRSVPPVLVILMVLSIVGMNLLANKSINTGVEWLALDCGILFSWLCFLTMDIMTHCYGPLALNLMMSGVFFLAGHIPGVWGESYVDGSEAVINTALDNTFGGVWYVILGSSVAFLVSSLVNNFLNYGIGQHLKNNNTFGTFALRSYVSTFIQCITCSLTGAVMELLFEVLFSPLGYRISRNIMEQRNTDAASQIVQNGNTAA